MDRTNSIILEAHEFPAGTVPGALRVSIGAAGEEPVVTDVDLALDALTATLHFDAEPNKAYTITAQRAWKFCCGAIKIGFLRL